MNSNTEKINISNRHQPEWALGPNVLLVFTEEVSPSRSHRVEAGNTAPRSWHLDTRGSWARRGAGRVAGKLHRTWF